MQTPVNGREWTKLLKHLDLFGNGNDMLSFDNMTPTLSNNDGHTSQKAPEGSGWIEVVNHVIQVYDGDSPLLNPYLKAQAPILLKVNGVVVEEAVQIASNDQIEIGFEPFQMFKLNVSEDRLTVTFQVISPKQYTYRLVNSAAVYDMLLTAETDETGWSAELNLGHVMDEIRAMGITAQINDLAIRNEINLCSGEEVVIATGLAPVPSIDARIEKYFTDEIQNHVPVPDERGVVDFRSHLKIPSVKKDELMARYIPYVPGNPGMDVFGQPIMPEAPKQIQIRCRQYCRITENFEIYAMKAGRPVMRGTDSVDFEVIPCFEWNSDVDFRCGNIFFDGDVIINGSVMEAMSVEANGRVTINGSIYRGSVYATHSVTVNGKVISGAICAGQEPPHLQQLRQITNDIHDQWVQWIQAGRFVAARLRKAKQSVRTGQLLMSLVHAKFQDLPRRVRLWMNLQQHITPSPDSPLQQLAESLRKVNGVNFWNDENSFEFLEKVEEQLHQASLPPGGNVLKASITVDQCQMSDLRASGDIIVRREGSIQSTIIGEGSVMFLDASAICRGGQVIAGVNVICAALGSEMGGVTMVKAGKEIVAKQVHQGKIYIGRHMREIWSPIRKMKAFVEHNHLVVTGTLD